MADSTFTPYWRPLSEGSGPNSWVFYVVAKIAGRHRPIAVVSSIGGYEEESLHGAPLVACCRRIVTILSEPANHIAIRSELSLAEVYLGQHDSDEHRPEPVELPKLSRKQPDSPHRQRPWDRTMVAQFPFISASLLQGVAFDPGNGRSAPHRPEPLATVYRDDDIEWGMVVFDITDPKAVRYGIVGFAVAMAKLIGSLEEERRVPFQGASFAFQEGPLRVVDEVRPRKAMSAAEYMAKFDYSVADYGYPHHGDNMGLLTSIPLVEATALSLVWPSDDFNDILPATIESTVSPHTSHTLQSQIIRRIVQETSCMNDLDVSAFDKVRSLPGFQTLLQQNLLELSNKFGNTRSSGRLFRLAFAQNGHLGLEQMKSISAESISAALDDWPGMNDTITSLSLCINSVQGSTPAQFADAISRTRPLRQICLLTNPTRESDALSVEFFAVLAARPEILSCTNIMFAGAFSAALRKRFWLPTHPSLTPMNVYPVQQIFVRHERSHGRGSEFHYDCIHLADGLLKPERFAAGFLVWLSSLEWKEEWMFPEAAPFFSFSTAPASLKSEPLFAAQVSPMLCENLALPFSMPDGTTCAPLARDLVLGDGWTVLVSQDVLSGSSGPEQYRIRYAFVRALSRTLKIDDPPHASLGPGDLEVLGLKEFLSATASDINPMTVDLRLQNTAQKIVAMGSAQGVPWPTDVDPLLVMTSSEAAAMLPAFLEAAKIRNDKFKRAIMKDLDVSNDIDWSWYSELLDENSLE
ncbi:hypothetical protein E8E14_002011 [Neopestalotiopsis sp. 37M]|nr:hypothetical protein E8E14_002011 [Neopestalotiopsis sp. 37M]